jgi:hypothetical protein
MLRGCGLQKWRIDSHILNKQSQAADRGQSSNLVIGYGPKNYMTSAEWKEKNEY